jgi:hypothetical protein
MTRTKFGLLGLCAVVLGLMAMVTSSAQAEAGAKWTVGTKDAKELPGLLKITEIENLSETVKIKELVLLSEILKIKTEFLCTGAELVNVELVGEGKLKTGGQVKFTGCVTKLKGVVNEACKPKSPGQALGTIVTNKGKGELVLHTEEGGKKIGITRLEPEVGTTFVVLELGEACAIGEKVPIINNGAGTGLTLVDTALGTASVEHLIKQGPLTELFTISNTVEHKATIDGSAKVALAGAEEKQTWFGTPG